MFQKGGHRYSPPLGYKININNYLLLMITIIKEAKEILKKTKWKNLKEKLEKIKPNSYEYYLINLSNLLVKNLLKVYYKNIDYLIAEIKELNTNIMNVIQTPLRTYNHKLNIEKHHWFITDFQNFQILDKFYLINLWIIFWWQLQIYWIYDKDKNKVWTFVYKIPDINKNNFNAYTSLELTGLFFKCYNKYFDSILSYFSIDRKINGVLKRLDYCVDFKGIEVPQILEYLKEVHQNQKIKNYNGLTFTDLKALQERNYDLQFWKTETGKKFINNANTLTIYDKILDIVQNYMKRKVDWINPYQDYLDSDEPITRIELKKLAGAFSKINDNSIDNVLNKIDLRYFDYLKKYFVCDFSLLLWKDISLNWKKDYLAKNQKEKKILHSFIMAQTYLKNIEEYCWKKEVYKFLFKLYPELEDIKPIELLDEFEAFEFIRDIFP